MDSLSRANVDRIRNLADDIIQAADRRYSSFQGPSARLGMSQRELADYSFSRALDCVRPGLTDKRKNCLECEISTDLARQFAIPPGCIAIPLDALEFRAMDSPSYLVGQSAPAGLSFIDVLRNFSLAYRLGAQRLTDLIDNVQLPRATADPSVTWLGPGEAAVPSDPAFGQISASPKTAVTHAEMSEQLLRQSASGQIVKRVLASAMAAGLDAAVVNGTGGAQPLGILNTPGVGSASGTTLGLPVLVGAQKTIADANAILDPASLAFATTPAVSELLKLRQRFSNTDSPIWDGALHAGEIEGVKAVASKQIPSATMLCGDWSTVYVCEFGPLILSADNGGTRFNEAKVGLRAMWHVDIFLSAPQAFVKIGSIT